MIMVCITNEQDEWFDTSKLSLVMCITLLIGNKNFWLSGGQEAIPYQSTEVCTYPCPYMEGNDDSYHMPVWIGIGIGISIGNISSFVLVIENTV